MFVAGTGNLLRNTVFIKVFCMNGVLCLNATGMAAKIDPRSNSNIGLFLSKVNRFRMVKESYDM